MVPFLVTIRTADRSPKRNYLGATVRAFLAGGCDPSLIHLFQTHPDVRWLSRELDGLPPITIHAPEQARTSNENGIAQVTALDSVDAEWIGLFEDDLETCADVVGSTLRWLSDHAVPEMHVYRLFALPGTPTKRYGAHAALHPLREMRGSQAVILRAPEARMFGSWATAHKTDWRPADAPYRDQPTKGFDKLIGYWALATWPDQRFGLLSQPMMIRHVGRESSLYSHGLANDRAFAGAGWKYQEQAHA